MIFISTSSLFVTCFATCREYEARHLAIGKQKKAIIGSENNRTFTQATSVKSEFASRTACKKAQSLAQIAARNASGRDLQEKSKLRGVRLFCVGISFAGIRNKAAINEFWPSQERFGFAELSGEQLRTRQLDERKGLGDEEESSDEEA